MPGITLNDPRLQIITFGTGINHEQDSDKMSFTLLKLLYPYNMKSKLEPAGPTYAFSLAELYRAVVEKNEDYDGKMVFGRITDKLFCRPSCDNFPRENQEIEIFRRVLDAVDSGYAPCPSCRPMEDAGILKKMRLVEDICDYVRRNPTSGNSLSDLEKEFKVNRYTIQKVFKKIMGISPRKYVEECRIIALKKNLREGEPLPKAVYSAGYNSQSWLYDSSSSKLGMRPSDYRKGGENTSIKYLTGQCVLGTIIVAETDRGICALSIGDSEEVLVNSLFREFPKAKINRSDDVAPRLQSVQEYFNGMEVNLPLDLRGTDFQVRVWSALRSIPYGETRTYNQVAEMIGKPRAFRAVANACASNHIPLIVPCHRVVRSDGSMGGYALGIERKKYLLELEKRNSGRE